MSARQRVVLILVAIAALVGIARTAEAHASLSSSDPAADSVLESSPDQILLEFTEGVDPVDQSIRLIAPDGSDVELGDVTQPTSESLAASVPASLADGTYAVSWKAVSADSHPIGGAFTFSVGEPSAPPDIGEIGSTATPGGSAAAFWSAVGRFASFAGIGGFVGTIAVCVGVAAGMLASRRAGIVLWIVGALAVAGTALLISAQAGAIGSSWLDWSAVVDTRSGRWWLVRLVFVVFAVLVFVPLRRHLTNVAVGAAASVIALALLAVTAAGGHAIAGNAVVAGFVATVVHLAAMSLWVGGLLLLAAVVGRDDVWRAATRFSPIALGSVVALVVTGGFNIWRQTDSFDAFVDSRYGRWLIVKLVIIGGVLLVAAVSRWLVRSHERDLASEVPVGEESSDDDAGSDDAPRDDDAGDDAPRDDDAGDDAPRDDGAGDDVHGAGELRRTVWLEVVGMVLVLAATAGLTGSPPPSLTLVVENQSASVTVDNRIVAVDLEPAVTGGTTMHVQITNADGSLDAADEITVEASLPSQDLGPIDIPTVSAGPNHVISDDANFPVPGDWEITVKARYGEFDQVVFTVVIPVT